MKYLILVILLFPFVVSAQNEVVKFETNKTWSEIIQQASDENKYIFVDCYATWCEPCKYMDDKVFTQKDVFQFLNKNFVNWKLQFDRTDQDSKEIQALYDEVDRFKKDYGVQIFPSYLIFDSKGTLVHRIVGGTEANVFLTKLSDGLNPETQYERLISEFEKDKSNLEIIKKVLTQAQRNQDVLRSNEAVMALVNIIGIESALIPDYFPFIINSARTSASYSFGLIRDNKAVFDNYLSSQKISSDILLSSVLVYEYVIPKINGESNYEIDFNQLQIEIENKHPNINIKPMMSRAKIQYYTSKGKWYEMSESVDEYINLMGDKMNPEDLNMYAQMIVNRSADKTLQEKAKKWIELTEEVKDNQ